MNRFSVLAVMGTLLACHAFAADVAPSPKRQVINCMVKQMSVSKTISYNEAAKLCKDQVKAQIMTLAYAVKSAGVTDYHGASPNP